MVMDIREAMIKALRKKYEAVIEEAKATAEVYLHRPVGIGEHPQFIEELDKLINTIAEAEDKLTVIRNRFDEDIPF
jgi:3-phosphoglycerate kinase|tara:strand:- start:231 stop:458 length:228 start_codon:yes stop_codon:yes gene_type:complete